MFQVRGVSGRGFSGTPVFKQIVVGYMYSLHDNTVIVTLYLGAGKHPSPLEEKKKKKKKKKKKLERNFILRKKKKKKIDFLPAPIYVSKDVRDGI